MPYVPNDWPGSGQAPDHGEAHVAPYTLDVAKSLTAACRYVEGLRIDVRRKRTCVAVLHALAAHIESDDSLSDGRMFASVPTAMLAEELGMKRETVQSAIRTLTSPIGVAPIERVWKPRKGQKRGSCYAFSLGYVSTNFTGIPATSGEGGSSPDMPDNSRELGDTSGGTDVDSEVPDNSPDMPDNSPDMPDNSPDMPDNSTEIGEHSISIPVSTKDRDRDSCGKPQYDDNFMPLERYKALMEQTTYRPDQYTVLDRPPF